MLFHRVQPVTHIPERMFKPPHWEWVFRDGVGWWVHPSWRDELLGPEGLRLAEWEREGRLTTVKTGPHRTVYRADLSRGVVYIKHFRVPDFRAKIRQWFRRGKGRNEGKRATRLAEQGIRTIVPVALGELRRRGFLHENFLVTMAIEGMTPLDRFVNEDLPRLPTGEQDHLRQELAEELGRFTARLHDAGFLHLDFHPGNVLVGRDSAGAPELAMIDLDALREPRSINLHAAESNLSLLNHYFWQCSTRTDRLRFLHAYAANRRGLRLDPKESSQRIERMTRAWAERLWTRWGRRCLGTNKYFRKRSQSNYWSIASRDVNRDVVRKLMADPDAPLQWAGTRILKSSRTSLVAEIVLPVGDPPVETKLIYKRFHARSWYEPWLSLVRPSRGWRAWRGAQHLASRALPTPRNLLYLCEMRRPLGPLSLPLPFQSYLLTLKEEPSITLADYLNEVLPGLEASKRRACVRRMLRAIARLIHVLHDRSISHRDLKAANILILGDPEAELPVLSLIDLVGVVHQHPIPTDRRVQNLTRVLLSLLNTPGVTRTDMLRFLLDYLPSSARHDRSWKGLWRAIDRATRGKIRKNKRRGRVLS